MAPVWLTEAELKQRWGTERVQRLADRDGDGIADAGVIQQAILDAEGRARSRLLARYQPEDLPSTTDTTPQTLKRIVAGLALWFLTDRHEIKGDDVKDAYATALGELTDIVRGGASLTLEAAPDVDLSGARVLTTGPAEKGTFTMDAFEDW